MSRKTIRVLVVDDSPVIRELICDALRLHTDMVIAGVAADGREALRAIEESRPDVVTLDLQMPGMDGLSTLDHLLANRPTPVIVVSALTQRAADTTLQALERGAMDYVAKPEGLGEMRRVFGEELPHKIRSMAGADVNRILQLRKARQLRQSASTVSAAVLTTPCPKFDGCVAIGISTGGPPALAQLFSALTPPLPPILIIQHMPPTFTGPFANRLNALSALDIKEAAVGDILRPNRVLLAPGGKHLSLRRVGATIQAVIADGNAISGHKPSVDVMMQSAAQHFGRHCLGVIMTGMGRDGADGCGSIRAAGGYVLGQDEATSDVYGMNKVAYVEGRVDVQVALAQMADAITNQARRRCAGGAVAGNTSAPVSLRKGVLS